MNRFRISAYAVGGFLLAILVLVASARGETTAKPAAVSTSGVTVQIDREDGTRLDGTVPAVLKIKTDYGLLDLDLTKVKTVDFAEEESHTIAIVELASKQHLHGDTVDADLAFTDKTGATQALPVRELRELRVQRPPVDLSLVAAIVGLVTLAVMEIVLGIDNVIFLAIVVGRLPKEQQPLARKIGLGAALGTRLLLLFSLTFLLGLTKAVFTLPIPGMNPDARDISWRDIILLVGGGFLIMKSVMEMHHKLEESRQKAHATDSAKPAKTASFAKIIAQIAIIDIVFSLDSVITAVGMVDTVWVMITAMVIAMLVMLAFAGAISNFVDKYPTIKVLALSFLILIGVLLVADGLGQHIDKGYVYFAMAFGVGVEMVNILMKPKGVPALVAEADRSEGAPLV
ncbi:MAG: TerC family protein [Gemmataceae bacterium]|nr:TerC family protein [Gemmataceae bacterium]